MNNHRRFALVCLLAFLLCWGCAGGGGPAPATAPEVAWDAERVTAIAVELEGSVRDLQIAVQSTPNQPIGGARRAQYQAREDLRVMQSQTTRLRLLLEGGGAREETRPVYRRISQLRRDLEEAGRNAPISESVLDRVFATQDLLRRLRPYYGE